MFTIKTPTEKTGLEEARVSLLSELASYTADDPEYSKLMVHVKTLTELIDLEKPEQLSPNTLALIVGNSIVAMVVVGYESKNIVSSKVLNFLMKAVR